MIQKVAYGVAGLGVSGLITLGVAFAQTTSPSPSPSASPSATTTTVPGAPPSTGMGGGN
jgi:hypothetical protein